ncbi:hypothetical protein [Streptomyces sp. NPDC000877]|uniref:hypothetical protein n=1 Tax=unclassified Streptomyces TaxID=2593676 RepID=UPI003317EAF0
MPYELRKRGSEGIFARAGGGQARGLVSAVFWWSAVVLGARAVVVGARRARVAADVLAGAADRCFT